MPDSYNILKRQKLEMIGVAQPYQCEFIGPTDQKTSLNP